MCNVRYRITFADSQTFNDRTIKPNNAQSPLVKANHVRYYIHALRQKKVKDRGRILNHINNKRPRDDIAHLNNNSLVTFIKTLCRNH